MPVVESKGEVQGGMVNGVKPTDIMTASKLLNVDEPYQEAIFSFLVNPSNKPSNLAILSVK